MKADVIRLFALVLDLLLSESGSSMYIIFAVLFSDGTIGPPHLTKDQTVHFFVPDICR